MARPIATGGSEQAGASRLAEPFLGVMKKIITYRRGVTMTASPLSDPPPLPEDDAAVAASVAEVLEMAMPAACVPGVAMNARLLASHWAVLREARGA